MAEEKYKVLPLTRKEAVKHLECLFSWAELYGKAYLTEQLLKTQAQIDEHRNKYDLHY